MGGWRIGRFSWSRVRSVNILIYILVQCCLTSWGMQKQTHQGSAPTNEFKLSRATPDARIRIDSSKIIVVNVEPPDGGDNLGPFKVGLELLGMELCDRDGGDRLKIVYSDPTSIRTTTWKVNLTSSSLNTFIYSSDEQEPELKDVQANQLVLIPEGRWVMSRADLVATLYQDPNADGSCPDQSVSCTCNLQKPSEDRCIPKALLCNGNPNCGLGCRADEAESDCPASSTSTFIPSKPCTPPEPPPSLSPSTTRSSLGESGGGARVAIDFRTSFKLALITIIAFLIR